jgi:hypothetical protein
MLIPAEYTNDPDGPKGLLVHVRVRGQRWYHLSCFGRKSHYRRDGSCEHTDALLAALTDYGRQVTKLQPWGDGEYKPKQLPQEQGK